MTDLDLAAIRQRADAATEGPWETSEAVDDTEFGSYVAYGVAPIAPLEWYSDSDAAHTALDVMDKADAVFIAAARTDIPALLDRLDLLGKKLEVQKEISRQNFEEWKKVADEEESRADDLTARLEAVRELHKPENKQRTNEPRLCEECAGYWPCATIQALEGDQ